MSTTKSRHPWLARGTTPGDGQPTDFRRGRGVRVFCAVTIGAVLILAGCSSNSATPSSTAVATAGSSGGKAPITIVLVTSLTGPGADQFVPGPDAFDARIALQNAFGGVNGHLIKGIVVDDQTVQPTLAIQSVLSKRVRNRGGEPAVLQRCQDSPATGRPGHWGLRRWTRVG